MVILNQDINRSTTRSNQALDNLMQTLQEIQLNDSFSTSLYLDDSSIEEVTKYLIEINVVDVTDYNYVDNVSIIRSVLEQHHFLHNDSNSNNNDFDEITPLVTVEQANRTITDFIKLFSIKSSLSTKLQSKLLCNLQRARCPLINQHKIEKFRLLKQPTIRLKSLLTGFDSFLIEFHQTQVRRYVCVFLNSLNCKCAIE